MYLSLTVHGWAVDQSRTHGAADSVYEQPRAERCAHDEALDDECDALIEAAEVVGLPSVQDIAHLL